MLYDIYKAVKTQLKTPENDINGNPRQGIDLPNQWFNMQYDGTMSKEKGFFVEFPNELKFEKASRDMRRAPFTMRLHYYSKVTATHDGVSDEKAEEHEALALAAKKLLDGYTPKDGETKLSSRLEFNGWRHWHRWKGWMVTYVEFETKKLL